MTPGYWWVACESRIYHDRQSCPALNRRNRWWPVLTSLLKPPPERRLCKLCATPPLESGGRRDA